MRLGVNKMEADEVITEVRRLDQERLNEEVLHGFSMDIVRRYWTPQPFIKPHLNAEALNDEAAKILANDEEQKSQKQKSQEINEPSLEEECKQDS